MNTNPNPLLEHHNDSIRQHQKDMRDGYGNGALGIIVSGLVWIVSAIVAFQFSEKHAIWTLFFGGTMIFPLSMLLGKVAGIRGTHKKGNPLGNLALEGTVLMIMCIPIAYVVSLQQSAWFFNAMLLIIGGRYLTFNSIYGIKLYWLLGALLGIAGYLLFIFRVPSFGSALTGGIIEIIFGGYMLVSFRKNSRKRIGNPEQI